mgnify:CR=1 FL=1
MFHFIVAVPLGLVILWWIIQATLVVAFVWAVLAILFKLLPFIILGFLGWVFYTVYNDDKKE